MAMYLRGCIASFVLLLLLPHDASAQNYSQTARGFIQAPQALGMGDTGVAFSTRETVFFYNPAHLAYAASLRPRITLVGFRGTISTNFLDQIDFFRNTLQPAFTDGMDDKSTREIEELYEETLAVLRGRALINGDALLPSVMLKVGAVGIGAGVFGRGQLRYRFSDAGAGIPHLDFTAMGDLILIGSTSVDLSSFGVDGLVAGLSGKRTQRWFTLKNKPIDAIAGNEDVYLFEGSSVGFDFGILYDVQQAILPGTLRIGLSAYDVFASDFEYSFMRNLTNIHADNALLIAEEKALADERYALTPSFRIGAAYMVPERAPFVKNTGITVDYVWYHRPLVRQTLLAGVHAGVQAQLAVLIMRMGLRQGYTTIGGGIHLGLIRLDYAYYGAELGRFPGQLPGWNHTAQIAIGL